MQLRTALFALLLSTNSLFGAAITDERPIGTIIGKPSMLDRPEGIAFSPDGQYVAIASSESYTVLFYRTSDCYSTEGEIAPVFVLGDTENWLGYPHDVSFSPDGNELAVACRHSNELTIHRKDPDSGFYEQTPFTIIRGDDASLKGINAVKFSPNDKILAVCDVTGNKVALFRYADDDYETEPYQILRGPINLIDRPDGLAFSSDGKLLAVTSHGTHSVLIYERFANNSLYFNFKPAEVLKGKHTGFCYTHSVCFHPVDDTLVVSSAGGLKTLSLFKKISNTVPRYSPNPSQTFEIYNPGTIHLQADAPEEGGVKGVAFSADGSILGICASDIADPARAILFYTIE